MTIDYENDSALLKALGHPVRLQIVQGLLNHECNVNTIVEKLGIPQSTASQHLAVLKNQGILQVRKEGVKICYRVNDARVAALFKVLAK
jgi:ArsR family transcriptional regulator